MVTGQEPNSVCFISFAICSPGWISTERVFNQESAECSKNILSSKIFSGSMHFINRYLQIQYFDDHLTSPVACLHSDPSLEVSAFLVGRRRVYTSHNKGVPFLEPLVSANN